MGYKNIKNIKYPQQRLFFLGYLDLLDSVRIILAGDEDCHFENLASGIEPAEGVFHIGTARRVGDVELPRIVVAEESLDYAESLAAARIAALGED